MIPLPTPYPDSAYEEVIEKVTFLVKMWKSMDGNK